MNRRALAIAVAVVAPLLLIAGAVVAFGGKGGHTPKKLPIAAGAAGAAATMDAVAPSTAFYSGVRYVAGPNLPELGGAAPAYRVSSTVDADMAKRVADAFGVHGDISANSFGFTIVDGDRQVILSSTFGPQFEFDSPGGSIGSPAIGCATTLNTSDPCLPPPATTLPPPPANLPAADDARATALAALGAAGVDTKNATIGMGHDVNGWTTTVTPLVNGVPVPVMGSFAVVSDGVIQVAGGYLRTPTVFDEYPMIGTAKAIANLNDGTQFPWQPSRYGVPVATALAASSDLSYPCVPTESGGSVGQSCGAGSVSGQGYACPATPPVAPSCPPPPDSGTAPGGGAPSVQGTPAPPEPQVTTLVDANVVLLRASSGQPGADLYLVPAYTFSTDSGSGPSALAIDASWLAPPPPPATEPPASSGGSGSGSTEVPCSTPGATGPCFVGPPESSSGGEPGSVPPAPPTTCGPPVESVPSESQSSGTTAPAAPAPASPSKSIGCPIN